MNRTFKTVALPILVVFVLVYVAQSMFHFGGSSTPTKKAGWGTLVQLASTEAGRPSRCSRSSSTRRTYKVTWVLTNGTKFSAGYPRMGDAAGRPDEHAGQQRRLGRQRPVLRRRRQRVAESPARRSLPFVLFLGLWIFLINQMQGGGSKVMSFGKSRAKRMAVDSPKITFKDVAGADEAVEELHEIKEFLENPKKFQALGARIPKGVLLYGPPGHGQDAAGARGRGRGGRAVLLDLRLRLRRDVRRRRRLARARSLRAGQAERAVHHLHGRDRRRRPPPRRRPGRRSRRARADPQPAAGRDGRLRAQGQHHPDRGHQPARHPRPRAAAPGPLRPPDRGRPPRSRRPQEDPRGAHEGQADRARDRPRRARGPDARLHRRRSRQPRQRGGAAGRPPRPQGRRPGRARGGDHARDRRPREEDAHALREGAAHHRLPRDGARDRRALPRGLRPGAQDLRDLARPGARLHDLDADRGHLPDHPHAAARHARDDAGRARRRGARVRRAHDGRGQRPREGHRDGEGHDHALRDERDARPARVRPQPRPAVPRPRVLAGARLLRGDLAHDRRGDPAHRRGGRPARQDGARGARRDAPPPLEDPARASRRSTARSSCGCSTARTQEEVFPPAPATPEPVAEPKAKEKRSILPGLPSLPSEPDAQPGGA